MSQPALAVDDGGDDSMRQLAQRLSLPLLDSLPPEAAPRLVLQRSGAALALQLRGRLAPGPVTVDFSNPVLRHRVADAVQQQAIARAVGVKAGLRPAIIDGTAGLGKDAFLLASLGCRVVMVESDPLIAAMLEDALQRAGTDPKLRDTMARLQLVTGDFCQLAPTLAAAEVVYLDPMFPSRHKNARSGKDMYVLQEYFALTSGNPEGGGALLQAALLLAGRRVVVKRPRHAPPLGEMAPHHSLSGSSNRYDVYLCGNRLNYPSSRTSRSA